MYTSKFHKCIFGQYLKRVNYVVYFRGPMDVDQSRMKVIFRVDETDVSRCPDECTL